MLTSSCNKTQNKTENIKSVNVVQVQSENDYSPLSFTGMTKAAEEVNVAFRVSGPIKQMMVKEGMRVSAGQVIAQMDTRDYNLQLNATQAEYEQIKADAERIMALYKEGNTTAQNYDKARYGLEQITQKLNNHKNQLSDTKLTSPISGNVKTLFHEAGETVAAGMPIALITSGANIEIEINLPAADYASLDKLTNFCCAFSTLGSEKYPLEIVRVNSEANANQLYKVRLRISGNYDHRKITSGMTTVVYVDRKSDDASTVIVPATAINNNGESTYVFSYDEKSECVRQQKVTIENINNDGTVTISGNVRRGQKIVSTGVHYISDGQKVKVLTETSKTNVGGLL